MLQPDRPKKKVTKKKTKEWASPINLFNGVFLGIGIKTEDYRYLHETYYLYSSSDHVFFLATAGTLMLPKTGTLQITDHILIT